MSHAYLYIDILYVWVLSGGGGVLLRPPSNPMLNILMVAKGPLHQVHIKLGAADPLEESLPES